MFFGEGGAGEEDVLFRGDHLVVVVRDMEDVARPVDQVVQVLFGLEFGVGDMRFASREALFEIAKGLSLFILTFIW